MTTGPFGLGPINTQLASEAASNAEGIVTDRMAATSGWAESALANAEEFLDDLAKALQEYNPSISASTNTAVEIPEVGELDGGELDQIDIGDFNVSPPNISGLSVNGDAVFNYSLGRYTKPVSASVTAWLLYQIANGGTGLGATIEAELWSRAQSRRSTEDEKMYNEALEFFSSRGFTLPPGALSGRLLEVQNIISRANDDLNSEITIKQAELAQANTHFAIDNAVKFEQGQWANHTQEEALVLEGRKADLEAQLRSREVRVSIAGAEAEIYKAQVQGQLAVVQARVSAYNGQVEAYKARIMGQAETIRAQIQAASLAISANEASSRLAIALMEAELQAHIGAVSIAVEAAKGGASVAAQIAAGAMSAVSTGVNYGYQASHSGSDQSSSSSSYSDSYSLTEILHRY